MILHYVDDARARVVVLSRELGLRMKTKHLLVSLVRFGSVVGEETSMKRCLVASISSVAPMAITYMKASKQAITGQRARERERELRGDQESREA